MNCVTLAWSLTGSVFGMQATAVKPPATADAAPVAIVSLCSCPGSRRWTCMSMSPGVTTQPVDVDDLRRRRPAGRVPTCAITPSSMQDVARPVDPVDRVDDPAALQQHDDIRLRLSLRHASKDCGATSQSSPPASR